MKKSLKDTVQNQGPPRRSRDTRYGEASLLERVLEQLRVVWGPDDRGEHVAWCVFHPDGHGKPPHQPNLYVSARGFTCHACGKGGSLAALAKFLGIWAPAGEPQTTYDYTDEQGNLLYQVLRYPPKRFFCRRPDGSGGWIWNLKDTRRLLYRLPGLAANPDATVYVVEGEKDADDLSGCGLVATTNPGGAGKWRDEYSRVLADRDVVILPDNDGPGDKHAQRVAQSIAGIAKSVKILRLPGLPQKGDVSDWLKAGHSIEELKEHVETSPVFTPSQEDGAAAGDKGQDGKPSQADRIVSLLSQEKVMLFHDETTEPYARVPVNSHFEVWHCDSDHFKDWLAGLLWRREQKAPSSEGMNSALNVIRAKAKFECDERNLHNRVARVDDAIWYDLSDDEWRAVKVTNEGWELVCEPPILFRRYSHQGSQVEPVCGACNLGDLLRLINIRDESEGLLLLVYIVSCMIPDIPHPIIVLHGSQGSAKTTALKMLRRLIDPSTIEILTLTRDDKELIQNLSHHWAPYFDNVTKLPGWISDALCRGVTGDGSSRRKLYSNDEDVIQRYRRCIGLSGINVAAQQPDLVDRCLLIGLERINEQDRKTEKELWGAFEAVRRRLFSDALSILSRSMALLPSIRQPHLPRMADFAHWGCAIAEALGWTQEGFLEALKANARLRDEEVLESSLVAKAIVAFMEEVPEWEGTASELLAELEGVAERLRISIKAREWPGSPSILSCRLNVLETTLAALGIKMSKGKDRAGRKITLVNTAMGNAPGDGVDDGETTALGAPSTQNPYRYGVRDAVDDGDGVFLLSRGDHRIEAHNQVKSGNPQDSESVVNAVHAVTRNLVSCQSTDCENGSCDDAVDDVSGRVEIPSPVEGPGVKHSDERQLPARRSEWPEPYWEAFDERAAIIEFDGGMSREDAEEWADTILRQIFASKG